MRCRCGVKNCRKKIGNILSVPAKTLQKHKRVGALQDYIIKELKKIMKNSDGSFILPKYKDFALSILELRKKKAYIRG
jgi:hypothetical protein